MLNNLRNILSRDIKAVGLEVELYPDDAGPWVILPGTANSGGTLVLHLVGNLRHFIGAQLGGSGYVRKREEEFSRRGLTRAELSELIEAARTEVLDALAKVDPSQLGSPSLAPVGDGAIPIGLWLMHLSGHLCYHLGQINYHRRILTADSTSAGGNSLRALIDEMSV
jgi:hypothetical protein